MKVKSISPKSRSFLRFSKYAAPVGENVIFQKLWLRFENEGKKSIKNTSVADLRNYLIKKNKDEREVYYAENLNFKDESGLQNLKNSLSRYILKRLKDKKIDISDFAGIVELHPTKLYADETSKNAHIHYWGQYSKIVSQFINEYIQKENLSNKIGLNDYAYGYMENGVAYYKNEEKSDDDTYYFTVKDISGDEVYSIKETDQGVEFLKEEKPVKLKIVEDINEIKRKFNTEIDDLLKEFDNYIDSMNKDLQFINLYIEEIKSNNLDVKLEKANKEYDDKYKDFMKEPDLLWGEIDLLLSKNKANKEHKEF